MTLLVAAGLCVLLFTYGIVVYNGLINRRNEFKNAFSQIDVQLQRRYELIPNLVEIARSYMEHESETLIKVTEARNSAAKKCEEAAKNPQDGSLVGALAQAEAKLSSAMGGLNLVMENYPEIKADETMRDLHEQLATTENRVGYSRQAYSDSVMRYNTAREEFPSNIVAGIFNFKEADLFKVEQEEMRKAIEVSFDKAA
jgi:LemA protein